jgi:hypothetical protein
MLRGHLDLNEAGLLNLLLGHMARPNWHRWADAEVEHDQGLAEAYRQKLAQDVSFYSRLREKRSACRDGRTIGNEQLDDCFDVIGELRSRLADASIDALEPDLVILDKFQRFKRLIAR